MSIDEVRGVHCPWNMDEYSDPNSEANRLTLGSRPHVVGVHGVAIDAEMPLRTHKKKWMAVYTDPALIRRFECSAPFDGHSEP